MVSGTAPAGWYPDPEQPGLLRYWDGVRWTDHRASATVPAGRSASPARRWWTSRWAIGLATFVLGVTVASALAGPGDDPRETASGAAPGSADAPSDAPGSTPEDGDGTGEKPKTDEPRQPRKSRPPTPVRRLPVVHVVSDVVDGDTLYLSNGQSVRLVGIDSPEVGQCGYDAATASLERLVLGRTVRLTKPVDDRDRYGRLLRYVDVGDVDAGLRQVKAGLAIARYDSRDGYDYHPRENRYIAADDAAPDRLCSQPRPLVGAGPKPAKGCAPGYDPCVPPFPPDVDCADVDGPVRVTGPDPHGLDGDRDGYACE